MAGNPRAARQVARILHVWSELKQLPWHRVVNRDGRISLPEPTGGREQRDLLEREGVAFGLDGRIDLSAHRWDGFVNGGAPDA